MSETPQPLVTVYITNFNYASYLEQAIESVLSQTTDDFELIIIDDGSTDGSQEILKKYEVQDRIFVIFQRNQGLSASNNVALKLAQGKYIMRLDADDYLDVHAVEIMSSALERRPDLALVFPDYYMIDEAGTVIEQMRRHDFQEQVSLLDQPAHGACTMIRRDILTEIGGYDEALDRQDGYDLWLSLIEDYPVQSVNLPLFYYRQHPTSLTRDQQQLMEARSRIKAKHVAARGAPPLSVLIVVPVRGSKTDPHCLPLAQLGDKRLIDWTLDAGLSSAQAGDIIVTTPDSEVQTYVREAYGNRVSLVDRVPQLARMNTGVEETILDALSHYTEDHPPPDAVLVLYIEAPFRSAMYIDKMIHTMQLYDTDVVDGVRPDDSLFYVHNGQGLQPWKSATTLRLERENLYRRVGGLHLIRREFLEKERKMLGGKIGHIVLHQKAAFVIRTELDWQIARLLAEQERSETSSTA